MFRSFKTRSGDAQITADAAGPGQSSPISTIQSENAGDITMLDSLTSLSKMSGISAVQHGARLAVVGELLVSILMHLPTTTRADIVEFFRDGIEDLMSLSDDRILPQQYHSALLTEINRYLNALRRP
jgi:hypothetical protein